MLVRFDTDWTRKAFDLRCRVTWRHASMRQHSEAEMFIPRASEAFDTSLFDDRRLGFPVHIAGGPLGGFWGVVDKAETGREGVRLHAWSETKRFDNRPVAPRGKIVGHPAGAIVQAAFRDAIAGLGKSRIRAGAFCEAPPLVPSYELTGQPFSQVLGDMQEATGQEWSISDDGAFSWHGPKGAAHPRWLCDSGDLSDGRRSVDINEMAAEVWARGSDGRKVARVAPEVYAETSWDRVVTLNTDTTSLIRMAMEADALLNSVRRPQIAYTFGVRNTSGGTFTLGSSTLGGPDTLGVTSDTWAVLREGDWIRAVLPYAGMRGACPLVRVLSRSYGDGDALVTVEVQEVQPIVAGVSDGSSNGRTIPAPVVPTATDFVRMAMQTRALVNGLLARG